MAYELLTIFVKISAVKSRTQIFVLCKLRCDLHRYDFHFHSIKSFRQVIDAISFPYHGGTTNTAAAIMTMTDTMFKQEKGDR